MAKVPTDLQILNTIYDRYYDEFTNFDADNKTRASKIYVPLDLPKIAAALGVDGDIVFGRLHYDMEQRYGFMSGKVRVPFFELSLSDEKHVIHFPYMASVLARLRDESNKFRIATGIAFFSLAVSFISLAVAFY